MEPFGFSLAPFVIGAGALVLVAFRAWERRREEGGLAPLVHFRLLGIPALRGRLTRFLAQNLILMGIFFAVPLCLQIVQGFDAFETGVRMLPVSVAMLLTSAAGSALAARWPQRTIVRAALAVLLLAVALLLSTIDPEIDDAAFAGAMALLGVGLGLIASQLGNVVQSAISERDRSEAGGLQYTAQQLGSALGTALIGAVLITGLIGAFTTNVEDRLQISADVSQEVGVRLQGRVSFVSADEVRVAASECRSRSAHHRRRRRELRGRAARALKTALLFAGFIVLAAFAGTRRLPTEPLADRPAAAAAEA